MSSWGIVLTVKAPLDQLLAFVAHHLTLGASQIWIYFDDPEDPAFAAIAALPRVTATLCTDAYWQANGGRPDRHQNRQARNARKTQSRCTLDWLGHLDADEFIWPARSVSDILADRPPDVVHVRMEPFEAMHDPALPDDIFTARQFRGQLRDDRKSLRAVVLGLYVGLLPKGHLSHAVGKTFCRPEAPGLVLRLHGVLVNGIRIEAPFAKEMPLLHFHAENRPAWTKALPFRLTRGAYQYNPALQAHLAGATTEMMDHFYDTTQILTAEGADKLKAAGRLITAELGLRAKVRALADGRIS